MVGSGVPAEVWAATVAIWRQRGDHVDPLALAQAMLGLDHDAVRAIAADDLLTWPETAALLDVAGDLLDRLTVLADVDDDAPEHQLLCRTLRRVVQAGADLNRLPAAQFDDDLLRQRREVADRARTLLEHPAISVLGSVGDHRRAERRVAQGTLRHPYLPALAFAAADRDGLRVEALAPLVDGRTALQHALLVAVLRVAWDAGVRDAVTVEDGALSVGPVRYRHCGNRGHDRLQGITAGRVLIDVPDWLGLDTPRAWQRLRARSGVHDALLCRSVADVAANRETILRSIAERGAGLLAT
ncbi:MAG: hypothetical protein ACRBI6_04795 [Acidimicrobiales bacterium]